MSEEKKLTAEEGADRVAARGRQRTAAAEGTNESSRNAEDERSDEDESPYTCENCGGHEFEVLTASEEQQTFQSALPCTCGETDAAVLEDILVTWLVTVTANLGVDHRTEEESREEEETERESVQEVVNCETCAATSEEKPEVESLNEREKVPSSEEVEVRCASCDHEIEFGWSHPDRGGRIWPCESADFNPWKSWPEPRFAETWARRGWLRPLRD